MEGFTKLNNFSLDLDELDASQLKPVISDSPNVLLRAPAGSGKTHCVLYAVANYRYNYLNDRICAITYTRNAREEMQTRLENMGIHDVEVTTIHV